MKPVLTAVPAVLAATLLFAGCGTAPQSASVAGAEPAEIERVQRLEDELAREAARNAELEATLARLGSESSVEVSTADLDGRQADLPPNALPGHCYARVLVPPEYTTTTERVLAVPASERVEVIPAKYEWVEERVLVKEASTRVEVVPAVYEMVEETITVKEPSERLEVVPAQFKTVDERVIVEPAREDVVIDEPVYETVTERVLVKPAHTTWKPGRGPIERIDNATGEIMCLVEVPAEYKTVSKRVLKTPAQRRAVTIPAKYDTITKQVMVTPETTRTVTIPGEYRTVTKRVMVEPPRERVVQIPAEYATVRVRKLVEPAQERSIPVAAQYETVPKRTLVSGGGLQWREILCETNTTPDIVRRIQTALNEQGYDPGPIDGVIGAQTMQAVTRFQQAKELPRGELTVKTIEELGVRL